MLTIYKESTDNEIINSLQEQYDLITMGLEDNAADLEKHLKKAAEKIKEAHFFIRKIKASGRNQITTIIKSEQDFHLSIIKKIISPLIGATYEKSSMPFSKQLHINKQAKNAVNISDLKTLEKNARKFKHSISLLASKLTHPFTIQTIIQ